VPPHAIQPHACPAHETVICEDTQEATAAWQELLGGRVLQIWAAAVPEGLPGRAHGAGMQ
jgi:hypothetical protein